VNGKDGLDKLDGPPEPAAVSGPRWESVKPSALTALPSGRFLARSGRALAR